MFRCLRLLAPLALVVVVGACGGDDADDGPPTIVVSSALLADVVSGLVGDQAEVEAVVPAGTDPHAFQPSARQVAAIREADALVINGGGLEEGLLDTIDAAAADGVPVYEAIEAVERLGDDPHFFTDPARMAVAAEGIAAFLADEVPALGGTEARARASAYVDELNALDAEVEQMLATVPDEDRVLVTNHDALAYFADRYGFEVAATVIAGGSTDTASAGQLADLAELLEERGVGAIFVDTSSGADLAETLAAEVDGVEVVALYSESLGDTGSGAETYPDLVRTNAERIVAALGGS